MRAGFELAWRHLRFNIGRSTIIVACLTSVVVLPITVGGVLNRYESHLLDRADSTPLLLGARGDRFDLVLKSLYFDPPYERTIQSSDAQRLREESLGTVIPLYVRHRVMAMSGDERELDPVDAPLVGTNPEYFALRGLSAASGTLPVFVGDLALGAEAASALAVAVGDRLLTRPRRAYDPTGSFQLSMPIVGILESTGTPDDYAVFGDVKTLWVVDGIGHGHDAVAGAPDAPTAESPKNVSPVVRTVRLPQYQEITAENRDSYHFHGATEDFPLTALILVPKGARERTLARGHFQASETRVLLEPGQVIREILGLVLEVKRLFDANMLIVGLSTVMFMVLVMMLSARLRRDEMSTLARLGCPMVTLFWVQAWELVLLLGISVVSATVLGAGIAWFVVTAERLPF